MTGKREFGAPQDTETLLGKVLAAAPLGVGLLHDCIITWANERLGHLIGRRPAELIGSPVAELYVDQNAFEWAVGENRRQLRENGEAEIETRLKRDDGAVIDVLLKATPVSIRNPSANLLFMALDISDRKRNEKELRESERRFREMAELLPQAVFEIDGKGRLVYVNQRFFDYFQYAHEDIGQGLDASALIAPEDRQRAWEAAEKIFRGQQTDPNQYTAVRKDGSRFPCLSHSSAIFRNDELVGLQGFLMDISELNKQAKALEESEEKYRELVQHAPAGICELDLRTLKLMNVNDVICEYLGHSKEELLSMNFLDLFSEESRQYVIERQRKVLSGEKVRDTAEYNLTRKDGREFWILVNTKAYFQEGIPTRATFVVHDITERKRLEDQLRRALKMEAVGRLAGGIAHDFNNLLTGLVGHVHLLFEGLSQDDPLREHVDEIKEAAGRAASLTRQLLAFSRKQVMRPRIIDLDRLIMDLEKMLRRVIGEHIRLVARLAPEQHFIEADAGQIEQLVVNLAINARDAMPRGGELILETGSKDLEEVEKWPDFEVPPGSYVSLVVSDTGGGMDEETRSRIFEPFFTTKGVGKGTGLGLASVYGIVRQSSGYVGVHSTPGTGTAFTLYFPRREAKLDSEPDRPIEEELPKGDECVLVVEDDDRVRSLSTRILQGLGYRVHQVKDAEQAQQFVEGSREDVDLLLTDIVMPGMNGWDLAQRIRGRRRGIKVLYMTGYSSETSERRCMDEDAILQKPFTPETLAQAVRRVLDGSELERPG